MGDINKVAEVIHTHSGNSIIDVSNSVSHKEQIFRAPNGGTTYSLGSQIVWNCEFELNNRTIDDISFRYNIRNNSAINAYLFAGFWPFVDRLEIKVNGTYLVDMPNGQPYIAALAKFNNYNRFSDFVADRIGTFIHATDTEEITPTLCRQTVNNGDSSRYESYLSEVIKSLHKVHVSYIRNLQLILYLKPATNIHKIFGSDPNFVANNISFVNMEMVIYFTVYKNKLPIDMKPLVVPEEFYEDKIYDVSAFAGQTTTIDIRIDTNYKPISTDIKKIFMYTDNTNTNAVHDTTNSFNVFMGTDIVSLEILKNGIRYLIYDNARALANHQNKYHHKRSRRRIANYLTWSQLNQVPSCFWSTAKDDLIISNDGHMKSTIMSRFINDVNTAGEYRLRITGNWNVNRPNLHVCLEYLHINFLFPDGNKAPYFKE